MNTRHAAYRLGVALLLALLYMPCQAGARDQTGGRTRTITVGGAARTFILYIPPQAAKAETRVPVVIALHGGAGNGRIMERFTGLDETANEDGFIVVYPDGTGRIDRVRTWNSGAFECFARSRNVDDVAFISALIRHLIEEQNVDPSRVYVTGISNGAMMAYRLAAEIPHQIAAIAAIAGTLDIDASKIRTPMPILHFHGTADEHVPYAGGHGPHTFGQNTHTSVNDTIAAWVHIDDADLVPQEESVPDREDDGTQVARYTYGTAADPEMVVLYKIIGGGHTWPGRPPRLKRLGKATMDVDANDVMWAFFKAHPASKRVVPAHQPSDRAR